jgi:hypothetical protein
VVRQVPCRCTAGRRALVCVAVVRVGAQRSGVHWFAPRWCESVAGDPRATVASRDGARRTVVNRAHAAAGTGYALSSARGRARSGQRGGVAVGQRGRRGRSSGVAVEPRGGAAAEPRCRPSSGGQSRRVAHRVAAIRVGIDQRRARLRLGVLLPAWVEILPRSLPSCRFSEVGNWLPDWPTVTVVACATASKSATQLRSCRRC